jgi:hydrogenase maturation protease
MDKTIILGLGSPFADDQAGLLVASRLLENATCQSKIARGELIIELANRPGLNLLNWLQHNYSQLFMIDMVKTNLVETGNIYIQKGYEILGFSGMLSSHSFGVANSLGLADALGIDLSRVIFWGIEGESTTPGDDISLQMMDAVDKTVLLISKQLDF